MCQYYIVLLTIKSINFNTDTNVLRRSWLLSYDTTIIPTIIYNCMIQIMAGDHSINVFLTKKKKIQFSVVAVLDQVFYLPYSIR